MKIPNSTQRRFTRNQEKICLFWTEDPSLNNFFHVMNFCRQKISNQACNRLYLLRNKTIGDHHNHGYRIHQTIFRRTPHRHLRPTLTSIHYLATYHQLVMAEKSKHLVIAGKEIDLPTLKDLLHQSRILEDCPLLQDLELVTKSVDN